MISTFSLGASFGTFTIFILSDGASPGTFIISMLSDGASFGTYDGKSTISFLFVIVRVLILVLTKSFLLTSYIVLSLI